MKLKQNKQSKLVIALSAVILLLVALSATLTFAYFTDKTTDTSGSIEFGVLKFDDNNSFSITKVCTTEDGGNTLFVPGCKAKLAGSAKLTNTIDAYVRLKVDVKIEMTNNEEQIPSTVTANAIISKLFADTSIENYFATSESTWVSPTTADGYKYYNAKVLKGAGLTIFDFGEKGKEVEFVAADYNNDWQCVKITITISAQTIQADHVNVDLKDKTGSGIADAIAGATAAWTAVADNTEA